MPEPTIASLTHNRDMLAIECKALEERRKELTVQRDELLAAAKAYLEREPAYPKTSYLGEMRIKLEAAIERAEKGK